MWLSQSLKITDPKIHIAKIRKNLKSGFREKLRKDRQTDKGESIGHLLREEVQKTIM